MNRLRFPKWGLDLSLKSADLQNPCSAVSPNLTCIWPGWPEANDLLHPLPFLHAPTPSLITLWYKQTKTIQPNQTKPKTSISTLPWQTNKQSNQTKIQTVQNKQTKIKPKPSPKNPTTQFVVLAYFSTLLGLWENQGPTFQSCCCYYSIRIALKEPQKGKH